MKEGEQKILRKNRLPSNYRLFPFVTPPQGWCLCYICISEDYNRALDLAMKLCTSSKDFQIKENPSPEALIKNLSSSSIRVIKDEVTLM